MPAGAPVWAAPDELLEPQPDSTSAETAIRLDATATFVLIRNSLGRHHYVTATAS
jgi:hypothetical protein